MPEIVKIILQFVVLIAVIALIVKGTKEKSPDGSLTESRRFMLIIGIILAVSLIILSVPDFLEGFKEGLQNSP